MNDYKLLTEETAITYVKDKTNIFSKNDRLVAKEFSGERQSVDGYCNTLILIKSTTSNQSVVLKQVLPYIRALKNKGLYLPVSLKRLKAEVNYIELLNKVIPDSVPKIYLWDEADSILIMEDLRKMRILRTELINMKKFPKLPYQLGAFLGKSAYYTSQLFLSYDEKNALENLFEAGNTNGMFEDLIFDKSILNNKDNTIYYKLQKDIDDFCNDSYIISEVKSLKDIFANENHCLIHTDLHSSNIFVDSENMKVFDSEFAHYGPISFDLGRIIGSIILNYASLTGMKGISEENKNDYQGYLLQMIKEIYVEFEKSFTELKDRNIGYDYGNLSDSMLEETIGFAACVSIARIYDNGLSFDFKRIDNLEEREKGQRLVIELARYLLINRKKFNDIHDTVNDIEEFSFKYVVKGLIEEAYNSRVANY